MALPRVENVRAEHLKVVKGFQLILDDINLSLNAGEGILLRGHNGAGKSTLLRVMAGLCRPQRGALRFNVYHDIYKDRESYVRDIAYLGHKNALKKELTVAENVACHTITPPQMQHALSLFGMEDLLYKPVRYFSSGQLRRVALARTVAMKRSVWLLDEPLVGLDRHSREQLQTIIEQHRRSGGCVMVSSHDPLELQKGFVLELEGGHILNCRKL